MSLAQILKQNQTQRQKDEVTEERLKECLPQLRALISFYREYPDIFIDHIKGPDCTFKFRYTQRVFLRAIMRHRYTYATFTRGFSKSFLSVMALILKAVLFPGSHLFVTTGGKIIIFIFKEDLILCQEKTSYIILKK